MDHYTAEYLVVLDHLDNSCFLLSSMLQSYSEPTLYSFVFSGTRPSANSESSSLANFEVFGRSLDTDVGLFEWFTVLEMGGTAGRGELRSARRGQSVQSHISRRYVLVRKILL